MALPGKQSDSQLDNTAREEITSAGTKEKEEKLTGYTQATTGYLTVEMVAQKFAVSRRTIERLVEKFQIPRRKFQGDRKLYYSPESVALLASELGKLSPNVERGTAS